MTRTEHLLTILAEECMEVAQRVTKALRFGLTEVQPGQSLTNAERITAEAADLRGAFQMLVDDGDLLPPTRGEIYAKVEKVEKFLKYSEECGTLEKGNGA